ncbi:DUF4199 domain-containing protein [Ichthyenterobacterium magnum]|uniref:Uncharacterized protein DUF4199 n=1 Tax=Ichthyenterobacterium magnum TaxID=1230530 RepID=A0A420DL98_9FLAO|nr:DUF4199 domain-containing protein [Ichthyenterobacterium magnum]RKE95012.1 uncharacterized protein DUF4199 [Ichthyenterobacterium magnum]
MEKSLKSSAINYGLYLGLFLASVTILAYAIQIELLTQWWLGIIMLIVIIGFGIFSTSKSKKMLNGFLTFKEAFSSYFITVAIGVLISMLVSIILFNFIDPDAAITLKEKMIEKTAEMMQNFGAPEDAIADTITKMEEQEGQFEIVSQLKSNAFYLVFHAVIGLIVAAIMKKANPDA